MGLVYPLGTDPDWLGTRTAVGDLPGWVWNVRGRGSATDCRPPGRCQQWRRLEGAENSSAPSDHRNPRYAGVSLVGATGIEPVTSSASGKIRAIRWPG